MQLAEGPFTATVCYQCARPNGPDATADAAGAYIRAHMCVCVCARKLRELSRTMSATVHRPITR